MLFALLLGATHLLFMGYEGWLSPAGWHGGLPPISLVAFAIFVAGYVINLIGIARHCLNRMNRSEPTW